MGGKINEEARGIKSFIPSRLSSGRGSRGGRTWTSPCTCTARWNPSLHTPTHTRTEPTKHSDPPRTIRSRLAGGRGGGGWICAYRRSRGRSGTGTGPRRRPRCRSPTAVGSAATTPTPTTPPPAPAAPPSTIHRSLPPRFYNPPPPPIRNPSSSSSSPRSIESKPTTTSRGRGWRLLGAVVD